MITFHARSFAAVLAGCALALAGCGSDEDTSSGAAPSASAMMADALTAAEREKSAALAMTASARGRSSDPQIRQFLAKPLGLKLKGGVSQTAVDLTGTAQWLGRGDTFGIRADQRRSFIRYADSWYGPGDGLESGRASAGDKADVREAVAALRKHGDRIVRGKVAEGPDLDGPTWQLSGPLNADGLVQAAKAEGEPMDADEQNALRTIAPLVKITVAVGQEDKLPRRVALAFDVTKAQIDQLRALADEEDRFPLEALNAKISLDLSKWGDPVKVKAPSDVQPMEALGGALLGALMQAGQAAGVN
jgi:hypothetical protein